MKTPVDQLFFRDVTLTESTTYSAVLDVRRHGADRTKDLVARIHWNNSKGVAAGSATFEIQTSAEGLEASTDWAVCAPAVTLSAATINDDAEVTIPYPLKPKQFIRLRARITTQFSTPPNILAGLDADAEWDFDETLMETR